MSDIAARAAAILLVDEILLETHYDRRSWKSRDRSAVCSAEEAARIERGGIFSVNAVGGLELGVGTRKSKILKQNCFRSLDVM